MKNCPPLKNYRFQISKLHRKMSSIDKLCLNWNEFQEKVCLGFSALRKDSEFADVTLACEDGSTQVGRGAKLTKSPGMEAA